MIMVVKIPSEILCSGTLSYFSVQLVLIKKYIEEINIKKSLINGPGLAKAVLQTARHGICQKVYTGRVFKYQLLPNSS